MKRRLFYCMVLFWCAPLFLEAQSTKFPSELIQGHTTATSVKLWLMVRNAESVDFSLNGQHQQVDLKGKPNWNEHYPVTVEFHGLEPDTRYELHVSLNEEASAKTYACKTNPAGPVEEYSFTTGSCALYGLGMTRLIRPGIFTKIFDYMREEPSDFFLWLGDNVYLLTGEWKSQKRMYEKYTKVRLNRRANAFLSSRPQYAILDDHDYGPDNGDATFANKEATTGCFKDFWPNPYFGADETAGTLATFPTTIPTFSCSMTAITESKKGIKRCSAQDNLPG